MLLKCYWHFSTVLTRFSTPLACFCVLLACFNTILKCILDSHAKKRHIVTFVVVLLWTVMSLWVSTGHGSPSVGGVFAVETTRSFCDGCIAGVMVWSWNCLLELICVSDTAAQTCSSHDVIRAQVRHQILITSHQAWETAEITVIMWRDGSVYERMDLWFIRDLRLVLL